MVPPIQVKVSCLQKRVPYGKCSKILNTFLFLFSIKMLIRAGIKKMIVGKANREDPDQTASEAV